MKLQILRKQLFDFLKKAFLENPLLTTQIDSVQLDVDLILAHFLGKNRTWIMFNRDFEVTAEFLEKIQEAVQKRSTGTPIAYITKSKEFFGLNFYVTPDVLIPKPDTEILIELAVSEVTKNIENYEKYSICDMCSGSGCVGISLLSTFDEKITQKINITFADISEKALAITKLNSERLLPDFQKNINYIQTNLFSEIVQTFDIIVTNPPYVPHKESIDLLKDGRNEPILALDGDVNENGEFSGTDDGLSLIKRLVPQCYEHLNDGGMLFMETGEYNAEGTAELFLKAGFHSVHIERDMNGMLRDVIGQK